MMPIYLTAGDINPDHLVKGGVSAGFDQFFFLRLNVFRTVSGSQQN